MRIAIVFLSMALACAGLIPSAAAEPARDPRSMVLLASATADRPAATLDDVAWLEGDWIGDMEDQRVNHVILNEIDAQMPGFVRGVLDGEITFYEITTFQEVGASLAYRVKHFTPELAGWEAQDAFIDRPLLAVSAEALHFDGITFARDDADHFTVYYRFPDGEREGEMMIIPFARR